MATHVSTNGNRKIDKAIQLLNEAARDKKDALQRSVKEKLGDFKEAFSDITERNREAIERVGMATKEAIQESAERVKEKAQEANRQVHKNPWPYIGGVAAGALVIGWLLGRNK